MLQITLCIDALFLAFVARCKLPAKKLHCTSLFHKLKDWMACLHRMENTPYSLVSCLNNISLGACAQDKKTILNPNLCAINGHAQSRFCLFKVNMSVYIALINLR